MDAVTDLMAMVDAVNVFILDAAASPWIYAMLLGLCIVDGFFPPLPSEMVVVALAAIAMSSGLPQLWLIILLAAAGAVTGDNIAYAIGARIGTSRFGWMRRPRVAESFDWARGMLDRRGTLLIMVARYIPIGRIAVNMTAGATGFHRGRFFWLTVMAGCSWSLYSVGIGVLAGHWVEDNPLLGVVLAVSVALVIGLAVDLVSRRFFARRAARRTARDRSGSSRREPSQV